MNKIKVLVVISHLGQGGSERFTDEAMLVFLMSNVRSTS
jgi:hypothetical protein